MAIREKLRKTFKRKDSSGHSTPSSGSGEQYYTGRKDIEYYKISDIPKSKYRGIPDPKHKANLEAYSFGDAFAAIRRKSSQALSGIVSPGGTKSQSRRASYMTSTTRGSVSSASGPTGPADPGNEPDSEGRRPTASIPIVRESSDDSTDPANVGLSRHATATQDERVNEATVPSINLQRMATTTDSESNSEQGTPKQDGQTPRPAQPTQQDQPFTTEELEKAMTRITLPGDKTTPLSPHGSIAVH